MIHACNATFSPDRKTIKTSSSVSALHTPPEEVSTVKVTIEEDSINVTQRDEYEMIEIDEQSEYSHVHGGSIRSPGTALSPSTVHCQGKLPITSFLSMSGRQSEPIFDSPVYTTIELDGSILTNSRPTTGEGVTNADSGYSHINGEDIPTESTNDVKFPMMSTGEQYVSELGHIYHLLERSRQNRSTPDSNEGSPNFQIIEDDSVKDRKESDSILPYSVVNGSPNQDSNKQKKTENNEDHSDSSSLQDSSMESSHKVIPLYSQVDKSKKKNRQLDQFDHQETQVIEQKSVDKIDSEKEGLTYHTIDHEP